MVCVLDVGVMAIEEGQEKLVWTGGPCKEKEWTVKMKVITHHVRHCTGRILVYVGGLVEDLDRMNNLVGTGVVDVRGYLKHMKMSRDIRVNEMEVVQEILASMLSRESEVQVVTTLEQIEVFQTQSLNGI